MYCLVLSSRWLATATVLPYEMRCNGPPRRVLIPFHYIMYVVSRSMLMHALVFASPLIIVALREC